MFSRLDRSFLWLLILSMVIPSTTAVDAEEDSDLQTSYLSTFMTTHLFNKAILPEIHYTESFQDIPHPLHVTSTFHLLQNKMASLNIEMDSTAVHTDTCIYASSINFAGVSSDSHRLVDTLLSASYSNDDFAINENDSVTLSKNASAFQYSDPNSMDKTILCGFRGDFLLKSINPVNDNNSYPTIQYNNSSNYDGLSQNTNPTKESLSSNSKNVLGANLLLHDSVLGSSDSLLLNRENEANLSSTSTADDIQLETLIKDVSIRSQNSITVLQMSKTSVHSDCEPVKFECDSSSSIHGSDKYIAIANVTGPVCLSADCLDVSHLCMCDQECLIYKDCCSSYLFKMIENVTDHDLATVDVTYRLESVRERHIESYSKTVYLKHAFIISYGRCILSKEERILMIGLCPASFSNEEDKLKCEISEDMVSITNIPVSQKDYLSGLNIHFKNVYCALCHNVSVHEFVFWDVTAECEDDLPHDFTYSEMQKKCEFLITPPEAFNSDIRTCIPNYFPLNECEPERNQVTNDREQNLVSLCQSYISPVTYKNITYRNMHCAACSTREMKFLSKDICLLRFPSVYNRTGLGGPKKNLKILLDFSLEEGVTIISQCSPEKKTQCKDKQMYDCVNRKCRTIYCHNEQTIMDDCVPLLIGTVPIALPDAKPFLISPDIFILDFDMIGNFNDSKNVDVEYYRSEIGKARYKLEFVKTFNITDSDFIFESNTLNVSLKITASMSSVFNLPQLLAILDTVSSREEMSFKPMFKSILLKNYLNESGLYCSVGDLKTTSEFILNHKNNTAMVYLYNLKSQFDISHFRFKLSLLSTDTKTETVSYCEINQTGSLTCQMVLLDKEEYRLENGSLYLINTTKLYRNGTFIIGDNGAFVCVDTLVGLEKIFKMFDYSAYQWILSVVAKALSMLALLGIIFFHIMFQNLRNLHGLNLTALSATLLLAHGLLFVYHIPTGTACQLTGILLHFLWLSVFAWVNIIGFDMTRTFHSGRFSVSSGVTRFFRSYLVVAFGIPFVLVTISVFFHIFHGPIDTEYGKNEQCWLGNQEAVIIFFLAPITMSVSINIILLGITIVAIEKTKKMTALVRSRKDRAYCLVYFKLTVILGLSWFAGIIAAFVDIPELWYVHIVFNGLQGFSIFICFALNARFLKAITKGSTSMTPTAVVVSTTRTSGRSRAII